MSIPASTSVTVGEIAAWLDAAVTNEAATRITGAASLASASGSEMAYYDGDRKTAAVASQTSAGLVITTETGRASLPSGVPAIVVAEPRLAFARALERLYARPTPDAGIHPSAVVGEVVIDPSVSVGAQTVIGDGARIEAGAEIGPGCVIGRNVVIGANTRLLARVTVLDDSVIGARCVIQPGVVIGSDGFGLAQDRGSWRRVPQVGRVVIGNDVDIGANTTIDRGALDDTVIDDGVKLDNLIQIAHNVRIGAHSAVAGCAGLAGSSEVGRHCTLGGGVGLAGHLKLADNVHITGMSMVTRSIHQPGVYSAGTPLDSNERWHRNAARFKQLDRLARRVKQLEKQLGEVPTREEDS
ncbi:UDP-3-O-(3-hydroxymyristoyl)glucosamine N-acyltransferase [Guyparkeria hydrothermalis]|uniref:UDP-3-O-(3-hydroxymyristoyl)glucosamine N-acyltransferase n=1 Tax=Guyparkeria hydrothermalis TaxID=923 RepID=UPI002020A586|nr:UDP-3-O-(3-hydroxymyristoyl)glucosamine N-acyltransferase [Guyparkeria hydrothermalis]